MLILCSNGLSSVKLQACVREKAAGYNSSALVVTADNEYKEKNYHVPRCIKELENLGLSVDIFDLDKQPVEALLSYDVVEFIGGNPFYLLHSIRTNNAADILKLLAHNKLLIGWSAAVFVFGPTLELVNTYSSEMNFLGLSDLNGLALTNVEVLPHYDRFMTKYDRFEERCRAYEGKHGIEVIRINDGDGVIIDADKVTICRA